MKSEYKERDKVVKSKYKEYNEVAKLECHDKLKWYKKAIGWPIEGLAMVQYRNVELEWSGREQE